MHVNLCVEYKYLCEFSPEKACSIEMVNELKRWRKQSCTEKQGNRSHDEGKNEMKGTA